ncbi:MAG TPA: urease subunit beta [Candidatus Methylomirabilis sp.]|nr:urease subunit beta [Candidatus Methylomirabilis sp.]
MKPGEYLLDESQGPINANIGRKTQRVLVRNTGDRPIQVGSHYHFFETNRALAFDRAAAYGLRLNIPAGTAVRFEPGEEKEVELVEFGGRRAIHGFNGFLSGAAGGDLSNSETRQRAIERARKEGFQFGEVKNK